MIFNQTSISVGPYRIASSKNGKFIFVIPLFEHPLGTMLTLREVKLFDSPVLKFDGVPTRWRHAPLRGAAGLFLRGIFPG
jgi:hypothetical protein